MAVPSSGQLRLRADINQEINGNDTDTNVSLGTLSNDAGFTEPDTMSEFYGYTSCGTPSMGSASVSGDPNGGINGQSILYTDGPSCNVIGCGMYVGTTTNIANATKYTTATSWGIYSWKYFNLTGYTNGSTYYVWIWADNGSNEGVSNMFTVTIPAAYIPVSISSRQLSGDSQIYTSPNTGCASNVINYYQYVFAVSSTISGVLFWQKWNTSYGQTCYNQCRLDYANQSFSSGTVTRSYYFEWNYNAAGGGYQNCFICYPISSQPYYVSPYVSISKSGYTGRTYSNFNDMYVRYQ